MIFADHMSFSKLAGQYRTLVHSFAARCWQHGVLSWIASVQNGPKVPFSSYSGASYDCERTVMLQPSAHTAFQGSQAEGQI